LESAGVKSLGERRVRLPPHLIAVDLPFQQKSSRFARVVPHQRQQQVFGANVSMAHVLRRRNGAAHHGVARL